MTQKTRAYFQLGRSMSAGGDDENAMAFLELAANSNYIAASSYLGEMFLVEANDNGFFDISMAYYKEAADGGYEPAKKVVSEFSDYFKERTLDLNGFHRGQLLKKLISGQTISLSKENRRYLTGITTLLEYNCGESDDSIVRDEYIGLQPQNFSTGASALHYIFHPEDRGEMLANSIDEIQTAKYGQADAELFIKRHGCSGHLINRLNEGIIGYGTDKKVILNDLTGLSKPLIQKGNAIIADDPALPRSIGGYYFVSNQGITLISTLMDADGDYAFKSILLEGGEYLDGINNGELVSKGYWFPQHQIVVSRFPLSATGSCGVSWTRDDAYHKPLSKVRDGVWKLEKDNSKPYCMGYEVDPYTCEKSRCKIFSNNYQGKENDVNFLVRDEVIARQLYSQTNKRKFSVQ